MGVVDKVIDYLRDIASDRGIPSVLFSMILMLLAIQLTVVAHESGHMLVANLLGCRAGIGEARFYVGWTGFDCPKEWPEERLNKTIQLIALAGPLTAFLVGSYLWFYEENGLTRVMALPFWFYGTLPNLYVIKGTDMSMALQYGLNPLLGLLIYFGISAFISFAVVREVTERRWV